MTQLLRGGDAIDPAQLPAGLDIYWGYPDGRWDDYQRIAQMEGGRAVVMSTVVTAADDGEELDIENGDATDGQAPQWWARQRARGVARPGFYRQVSGVASLMIALGVAKIPRSAYRLRTAHYGAGAHICSPACYRGMPTTADATQWIDHGGWDESLCSPSILDAPPAPSSPTPAPLPGRPKEDPLMLLANDGQAQFIVAVRSDGSLIACPMESLSGDPAHPELAQIAAAIPNLGTVPTFLAGLPKGPAV